MKKFETLRELLKCDREMQSGQMLKKMVHIDLLNAGCHKPSVCNACEMQWSQVQLNEVYLYLKRE